MRAHILNHYSIALVEVVTKTLRFYIGNYLSATSFFLLVTISSYAQPKFKIFDTESGLSDVNVTSIVQDQTGYLWIGTTNGLNRFDGNSFKVFKYNSHDENSISGNSISCLAVDKFNRIWIGHESSITCYDPALHKFTRYWISSSTSGTTFISVDKNSRVWVGVHGEGALVLNAETGVIEKRIDLTQFINKNYPQSRRYNTFNIVTGMLEDSSGGVWLATHDGLYLYNRKLDSVKPVRVVEDDPEKHRDDYFRTILDDRNGGFWLASFNGGVCHYSPKQKSFSVYQPSLKIYDSNNKTSFVSNFPVTNTVGDIAWRSENELWLITYDEGKSIGSFNLQTKTFNFLKLSEVFGNAVDEANLLFSKLLVDRSGVVWLASDAGLVMINPRISWDYKTIFTPDSTLSIGTIVEDTILKKCFMGTYGQGLIVSDINDKRERYNTVRRTAYSDEYILDLLNTGGDSLWVVSQNSIRLFNKVEEKWIDLPELQKLKSHIGSINMGPISHSFYRMIKTSTGDYWIVTFRNGVYNLRSDLSFVNYMSNPNNENSLCSNMISDLLEDKFGRIWFASRNAGISILDPATNTFTRLNSGKKGSLFLSTNAISKMDIDKDGNVWLASLGAGVIKMNVVRKDSLSAVHFDHELLTGSVGEIKIDGLNRVWFASYAHGVHMLEPRTMNIKSFEQDGLPAGVSMIKSNNRVLVKRVRGYGVIDERDILPDTTSNQLVINSIKVFGEEIYPEGTNRNHISLSYDQNSVVIDFAAIDLLYAKKINYSYKLEGTKAGEWSAPSGNKSTEFANLSGGDYVFKLKTSNHEGIWSKEKNLLYIHIETPFWKTRWFFALVVLAFIGLTISLYYYQLNRNKRISQLQLKALHTQMRPHFIFNCLSAINGQIIKFETAKASEFLTKFSRLMRGILENSTESWITLEQEIETLRLYLVMEGLRFDDKFSYDIEVEEGIDPSKTLIPSMILQPYVENAIGHGLLHKEHGAGIINIKFLKGDGNLKCIIEDNGIGRERSSQMKKRSRSSRKSLGMQITSERLQLLQGSLGAEILDLKNDSGEPLGTRVIVMLLTKKIEEEDLVSLN